MIAYFTMPLVVLLNGAEIFILERRRKKKGFSRLLLSLSTVELLRAIVSLLMIIAIQVLKDWYTTQILVSWAFVAEFSRISSTFHLIFITFDRLWAISFPFNHIVYCTTRKITIVATICWVFPLLVIAGHIWNIYTNGLTLQQMINYIFQQISFSVSITMLTGNMILIICYATIGYIIFYKSNADHCNSQQKRHHKSLILCISIVATFLISTTPYIVLYLFQWSRPLWLVALGQNTFAFNSSVNSILFLLQSYHSWKDKRQKKKKIVTDSGRGNTVRISLGTSERERKQCSTRNKETRLL